MTASQFDVFQPVSRSTISAQIRDQLLAGIAAGQLAPGDRVPSERALSERFEVARTSVREAMQGLVSLGVIERRGNRSYVVEHLPEVSLNTFGRNDLRELLETRRVIEISVAELAARRATTAERTALVECATAFDPDLSATEFVEHDRRFHAAMARAAHNPVLGELADKVRSRFYNEATSARLSASPESYGVVAAAVRDADEVAAAVAVEAQLEIVERAAWAER